MQHEKGAQKEIETMKTLKAEVERLQRIHENTDDENIRQELKLQNKKVHIFTRLNRKSTSLCKTKIQ